jgi:RNA polymerase sigma factor (sigma-70 family)
MDERRRRFEELVLPHLDAAANLARWLTRSTAEADDIVQDAMLRAFRAFDGFRGGSAKPWLLAIVRNCHVDTMTAKKRYTALPETHAETAPDPGPDPETGALQAEQSRGLAQAVARLPREFREALILREMEEMSYRDIATATGVPVGTVMSRLARARALLRENWLAREMAP